MPAGNWGKHCDVIRAPMSGLFYSKIFPLLYFPYSHNFKSLYNVWFSCVVTNFVYTGSSNLSVITGFCDP